MRLITTILIAVGTLALAAGGCVRQTEVIFEDQGEICAMPEGHTGPYDATMVFEAGDRVSFHVAYDGCLSSSCDVNRHMTCDVTLDGTQLVVHSAGGFTERDGYVSCTDDCGWMDTDCLSEPLAAGTYVIVHGEDRLTLTVPSEVQGLCEAPSW